MSRGFAVRHWTLLRIVALLAVCSTRYIYWHFNRSQIISSAGMRAFDHNTTFAKWKHNYSNNSHWSSAIFKSMVEWSPKNETSSIFNLENNLPDTKLRTESRILLTLFTTWVTSSSKYVVYNNTVTNWAQLKPLVRLVVFTDEPDVALFCIEHGWNVLPVTEASFGIPVLKQMYIDVIARFDSLYYAYSNADILYTDTLVNTLVMLRKNLSPHQKMLVVGIRTNVRNVNKTEAQSFADITKVAKTRGQLFKFYAEDYFITTKIYPWKLMPPVVVGRPAYDNWLVFNARKNGHLTIDATRTILAVHQTTDAGNFEGRDHAYSKLNKKILQKWYKPMHYHAGYTKCCTLRTKHDANSAAKLLKRDNVPTWCFPV